MLNVFFTSDLHIGHPSVLYFHPPRREALGADVECLQMHKYELTEAMNDWIVETWNSTVDREDHVYMLGDFCLGDKELARRTIEKLKGRKFLIRGNHDKSLKGLENYFEWVGDIKEAKFTNNQYKFIDPEETFCVELCHYPLLGWNRRMHGTCMVHGHTHGSIDTLNAESGELRVDVGWDSKLGNHNLVPLETLYRHMKSISVIDGKEVPFKAYINWKSEKDKIRY